MLNIAQHDGVRENHCIALKRFKRFALSLFGLSLEIIFFSQSRLTIRKKELDIYLFTEAMKQKENVQLGINKNYTTVAKTLQTFSFNFQVEAQQSRLVTKKDLI